MAKTSLKESTRRKGELRIAQQKIAADIKAGRIKAPTAPKAKRKAKAKKKGRKALDVRGFSKLVKARNKRFESVFE